MARRWISLVCTALWLSATLIGEARGEGYAVIVGVNECPEFRLPDGSRPRPLRGAENDADAMAKLLVESFGFTQANVQILKGPQATHDAIRAAIRRAAARVRANDQFVFHYSGHGTQIPDRQPFDEPDGLDEALCPWDSHESGEDLLVDDDLGLWLGEVPAGRITVILDCCHAGTGTKEPDSELASRFLPTRWTRKPPQGASVPGGSFMLTPRTREPR